MPLFLLYFIILTNLYCAKTLNIVLSFVIDVHFVMVVLLVFPKMWRFYNPVWIYGRKINDGDDDDDDDDDGVVRVIINTSFKISDNNLIK